MNITDQVKELIADGKTQEALEWLQSILKNKGKDLLNQTYLLESQYKDMKQRMRLGLQDASADLNRINYTLLSLCDDIEKAGITGEKRDRTTSQPQSKDTSSLAIWIFAIACFIGIAVIVGLVLLNNGNSKNKNSDTPNKAPTDEQKRAVSTVNKIEWAALPNATKILSSYYGDFRIEIQNIVAEAKDANSKRLTLTLKLTCDKTSTGFCRTNYLEYRLIKPNGDKDAPLFDGEYKTIQPKEGTNTQGIIQFEVPNDMRQVDLQIYYRDEKDISSSILKLTQK